MPRNSLVEARRRAMEDQGDEDFALGSDGTIARLGLDNDVSPNQQQGVSNMPVVAPQAPIQSEHHITENVPLEQLEGTVALKTRSTLLVDVVSRTNVGAILQNTGDYYQINAPTIRVIRQDVESILGKLNDAQWRMLFMNHEGEVKTFNNYEFLIGNVAEQVEERKELAQINIRIDRLAKDNMDTVRGLLNMTQAEFLEVAIQELTDKILSEKI